MTHPQNIEFILPMTSKEFIKYTYQRGNSLYVIEEDVIGWYLIVYCENENKSSRDYLFDTLEEALFEAEDKFNVPKSGWQKLC